MTESFQVCYVGRMGFWGDFCRNKENSSYFEDAGMNRSCHHQGQVVYTVFLNPHTYIFLDRVGMLNAQDPLAHQYRFLLIT